MLLPAEWATRIWNVPPSCTKGACSICHGALLDDSFTTCYKCGRIWSAHRSFGGIQLIVPCSVAMANTDWYRAMLTYKAGSFDTYAPVLVAVLADWFDAQRQNVYEALGGPPDIVAVVPSKKRPMPTPLWNIVRAVPELRTTLTPIIDYMDTGVPIGGRDNLIVDRFQVGPGVAGASVLLIEDTWVGGRTPMSAALALVEAGAASVALVPIARMVDVDTYSDSYETAAAPPYVPNWPK